MFGKQKEKLKNKIDGKKEEFKERVQGTIPDSVKDAAEKYRNMRSSNYEFDVAGCYYHQEELESLGHENPSWLDDPGDGRIYKYDSFDNSPVQLAFETGNVHDRNAIMVIVSGKFVGYVPRDENEYVGKLMKSNRIINVTAWVYGGSYAFNQNGRRRDWRENIECTVNILHA